MKIYLDSDQHSRLLDLLDPNHDKGGRAISQVYTRKVLFEKMFPKLKYKEAKTKEAKSYFGKVSGDEKDLTLFLLKL